MKKRNLIILILIFYLGCTTNSTYINQIDEFVQAYVDYIDNSEFQRDSLLFEVHEEIATD